MKIVKVKVEDNQEFEIKVEDKDLDTLIKVIKVFEIKESGNINPWTEKTRHNHNLYYPGQHRCGKRHEIFQRFF